MTSQSSVNCARLREAFEGREAIYVEKGVLRVRMTNIRYDVGARWIEAYVEEVPTPGLERSLFHGRLPDEDGPLRWRIGAGSLTGFSSDMWEAGYGGWTLYTAADVVRGFTTIASEWPAELDRIERYKQAVRFLMEQHGRVPLERVFSEKCDDEASGR